MSAQDLADNVQAFARRNFPGQSSKAAAYKVMDEAFELIGDPDDLTEAADVLITLCSWLAATGYTLPQLIQAADKKMLRNWRRTWKEQPDGTFQHTQGTAMQS